MTGSGSNRNSLKGEALGLWKAIHNRHVKYQAFDIFGYAFVPPTPFLYKDWEKSMYRNLWNREHLPEEGKHSADVDPSEIHFGTIQADLEQLTQESIYPTPSFSSMLLPGKQTWTGQHWMEKWLIMFHLMHRGSIAIKPLLQK